MQNRGLIRLLAISLALVCFYQLYFTFITYKVEKDAKAYGIKQTRLKNPGATPLESEALAQKKENLYLDSIASQPVYNFLGLRKYTYREVNEYAIPLGLDLKGGMNVTLEISVVDLIKAMSGYSTDSTFSKAIALAKKNEQTNGQDDFVTLFGKAFETVDPNAKLAAIFNTLDLRDKVNFNSTNADVIKVIRKETNSAIDNSFQILRTRIDRFGVAQPNIQQLQTKGRILVELPGVKDPKRVRKLLQGTANLEFWETTENSEVYPFLLEANKRLRELNEANKSLVGAKEAAKTTLAKDSTKSQDLLSEVKKHGKDSLAAGSAEDIAKNFPLFSVLSPSTSRDGQLFRGPVVGYSHSKDTAQVSEYLGMPQIKALFPRTVVFRWTAQPTQKEGNFFQLIALKVTNRDGRAPLDGGAVIDSRQDFGQNKATSVVEMSMNAEGSKIWQRMTRENVGKSVAVVLDNYVQSFPTVQGEIPNGRTEISGNFTVEEAKDLANMLKSGKMPASAKIVAEEIVGPTLGKESIQSGMISFFVAFLLVLS